MKKGRSSLWKFSLSLQSAVESVTVTHEVGSIFVHTRVCSDVLPWVELPDHSVFFKGDSEKCKMFH